MVILRALGTAEIETDVATLTPSQEIVFAAALYLILERGRQVNRELLSSMLWPQIAPQSRAHRLRQTLLQLKKLGIAVTANRVTLHLGVNDAQSDADELREKCGDTTESLISFDCLPAYNPRLSEPFKDWVDSFRTKVHTEVTRHLVFHLHKARSRADWDRCDILAQRCRKLDPFNECAVLTQAEAAAMRGSKREALSILDEYIAEIGSSPDIKLPPILLRKRIMTRLPETQPSLASEPNFVGREAEFAYLLGQLRAAQSGNGGACLVAGDAGIGKTRLFSELAKFAELEGVRVHRIVCSRSETRQPLASIIDLIPALREMPGALGCAQETLLCLKRLTELDPEAAASSGVVDDSGAFLKRAFFDLIDAISEESPILILAEDIQWLDPASAGLFASLIHRIGHKPVMCVFNSRSEDNALITAVERDLLKILRLAALPREEAGNLIERLLSLPKDETDKADIDWLINAGEGNPFFLQELVKHWLETGKRHDIPPSVSTILHDRVGRLSPLGCQVLQTCALLGEDSNLDRVGRVLEYPSHDLLSGIQELTLSGMLRSPNSGEDQIADKLLSRHDLVSAAALERLAPLSATLLHRRCAIALEQEVMGLTVSIALLRSCAFHWSHAGDADRAYSLAMKCANHLLEIGLAADAAAAFEGALTYCPSIEKRLDLMERIVNTLVFAREWARVLIAIAETRRLRASNGFSVTHDNLEAVEFEALRRTAFDVHAVFARTLRCVYDESLQPEHRVEAAAHALKVGFSIANMDEMPRVYNSVRKLLTDPSVDSRTRLQVELVYNTICGDLNAAVRQAKWNVRIARGRPVPSHLIGALGDLSMVLRRTGPVEQVRDALLEAYEIAVHSKIHRAVTDMTVRIADLYLDMNWPEASEWVDRACLANGVAPDPHLNVALYGYRAKIAMLESRFADADEIMRQSGGDKWLPPWRGWHAAHIAIEIKVKIGLSAPAEVVAPYVQELADLFEVTSTLGGQDYEVAALYLGLSYLGRKRHAESFVIRYLDHARRDITPLREELRAVADTIPGIGRRKLARKARQLRMNSSSKRKTVAAKTSRPKKPD
jgi:DNA-binding SARP family transcriptional activator